MSVNQKDRRREHVGGDRNSIQLKLTMLLVLLQTAFPCHFSQFLTELRKACKSPKEIVNDVKSKGR